MGLNETLDRLAKEREARESKSTQPASPSLHPLVKDWAARIFFEKMLKDINPGMSEKKIEALIERSIMIAPKLADKLYAS